MNIKPASINVSINLQMVDATDGHTPETGLAITDIDMTYIRPGAAAVKADATALAAVADPHADNKAIEIGAANAPGVYRFDFPDAAFASGVSFVTLAVVCAGCQPVCVNVTLSAAQTGDCYTVVTDVTSGNAAISNDIGAIAEDVTSIFADTDEMQAGLASPAEPSGLAATGYEMLHQLFGRFFYKNTMTATKLTSYDSADAANTEQTIVDDGTTQTVEQAASLV
jgi:hypothetical protein